EPLGSRSDEVSGDVALHDDGAEASRSRARPPTPATPLAWQPERAVLPAGARVLGRYRLEGAVRSQVAGVLHRARSLDADRPAFLLLLHAPPSDELTCRLDSIVEQHRELEHGNVVRLVASGSDDDTSWIASEPLEATT